MSQTNKNYKNNKRKTFKNIKNKISFPSQIAEIFLGMLNTIKLYHWKTFSYAQHKATDELYSKLNDHIDSFIEVLLGKTETRIYYMNKTIDLHNYKTKQDFKSRIYEYRKFLINLNNTLHKDKDTDLLNIRDEILADINQFLYLLTFNK